MSKQIEFKRMHMDVYGTSYLGNVNSTSILGLILTIGFLGSLGITVGCVGSPGTTPSYR